MRDESITGLIVAGVAIVVFIVGMVSFSYWFSTQLTIDAAEQRGLTVKEYKEYKVKRAQKLGDLLREEYKLGE